MFVIAESSRMNSAIASTINATMMSDTMSEPSSPESASFDDSDLLNSSVHDEVQAQLAAAGPIGVAAAAAIATGKKRKRPHSFETNPSIRKRQQTRLLRKLKNTIEEYTTKVGQQAVVLCCTPGKPSQSSLAYKVFGSQPLENCVRNRREIVMQDLEQALAQQTPAQSHDTSTLHELPPLVIDGIPTPVDKMTQAQLRAFIPEMLKYSTGRSKPGWGKSECRPVWWPSDLPWANVRSDVRTEDEKKKVSWTHALRTIVKNCYKHHGRADMLPDFSDDQNQHPQTVSAAHFNPSTVMQTINNPDGTVSIIHIDTGDANQPQMVTLADGTQAQIVHTGSGGSAFITLADGSQAQLVRTIAGLHNGQHEATQAVQTLAEVAANQHEVAGVHQGQSVAVEMNVDGNTHTVSIPTEATLSSDGQIILTGDASGLGGGDGMVTIPVSMYQTVVNNLSQLNEAQQQSIASVTVAGPSVTEHQTLAHMVTPKQEEPDDSPNSVTGNENNVPVASEAVEVITVTQMQS